MAVELYQSPVVALFNPYEPISNHLATAGELMLADNNSDLAQEAVCLLHRALRTFELSRGCSGLDNAQQASLRCLPCNLPTTI